MKIYAHSCPQLGSEQLNPKVNTIRFSIVTHPSIIKANSNWSKASSLWSTNIVDMQHKVQ